MIKDIRVVEWEEKITKNHTRTRWQLEIMYEGSTAWTPITFKKLKRPPKKTSRHKVEER
jgi:hypothetical protein